MSRSFPEEWLKALMRLHDGSDKVEALGNIEMKLHEVREIDEDRDLLLLHQLLPLDHIVLDRLEIVQGCLLVSSLHISVIVRVFNVELKAIE